MTKHVLPASQSVPLDGIRASAVQAWVKERVQLPATPPGREVYPSRAEVDRVVAAAADDADRAALLTLAYCGLRWGELAGLRRSPLVGVLDGHLRARAGDGDLPVFTNGVGEPLSRHNWPRTAFRPAVAAALGRSDVRVHDLRHSQTSWLVLRSADRGLDGTAGA